MGNCLAGLQKKGNGRAEAERRGFKVCVCGGSTKIGKTLCMLLALDPRVSELSVQDLAITMPPPETMAEDLRQLATSCKIRSYALEAINRPVDHLRECLTGCDLVIVCTGWPNVGRTSGDILKLNSSVAKNFVEASASHCPNAIVGLCMDPLNSLVPAMARLYEKAGLNPLNICGITSLDTACANKLLHVETGTPIEKINVPVIGGHGGATAVPVFSHDRAGAGLSEKRAEELIRKVQRCSEEVTEDMQKKCGPTLSQAYACKRFAGAVLNGLLGRKSQECCFVKSDRCDGLSFCASTVSFGPAGVEQVHPLGVLSKKEKQAFDEARKVLAGEIEAGLKLAEQTELSKGGPGGGCGKS